MGSYVGILNKLKLKTSIKDPHNLSHPVKFKAFTNKKSKLKIFITKIHSLSVFRPFWFTPIY